MVMGVEKQSHKKKYDILNLNYENTTIKILKLYLLFTIYSISTNFVKYKKMISFFNKFMYFWDQNFILGVKNRKT